MLACEHSIHQCTQQLQAHPLGGRQQSQLGAVGHLVGICMAVQAAAVAAGRTPGVASCRGACRAPARLTLPPLMKPQPAQVQRQVVVLQQQECLLHTLM